MSDNTGEVKRALRIKKLRYAVDKFEKDKLNAEQRECDRLIQEKTLTVVTGKAGSGKTLLSCFSALRRLAQRKIDQIIITRPTVSTEDNGFLPGDINEKLDPWMSPIFANIKTVVGPDIFEQMMAQNLIEIVPLTYMRGRTFVDCNIIVDEAQNLTHEQTLMCISRIGIGSKMVVCGDTKQIDLKTYRSSGLAFLQSIPNESDIGVYQLKQNHRHAIVDRILDIYENNDIEKPEPKIITLKEVNQKRRRTV